MEWIQTTSKYNPNRDVGLQIGATLALSLIMVVFGAGVVSTGIGVVQFIGDGFDQWETSGEWEWIAGGLGAFVLAALLMAFASGSVKRHVAEREANPFL